MIDLNGDMGEAFGPYHLGNDRALLDYITSANIACAFHASDPQVMDRTIEAATQTNVALGAHPGHPDRVGFGRRTLHLSPEELRCDVMYQVSALSGMAHTHGARLEHVKPHGALYHQLSQDVTLARTFVEAVRALDPSLIVVTQPGALYDAAQALGSPVALEAFCDRAYLEDGSLAPRSVPGAVLHDLDSVVAQAVELARSGTVTSLGGKELALKPQTLCIHSDTPGAPEMARALLNGLTAAGVAVRPLRTVLDHGM